MHTATPEGSDIERVFSECYPGLVRYCRRLTGDTDVAEDIAQEAIVRLFERKASGEEAALRAWLYTTATRLIRDRERAKGNRRRLLAGRSIGPRPTESPDRVLEREEAKSSARAALEVLRPRDREVLLLRHSGFSYREIAEAVEVREGSVGTLLARAERRFMEAVAQGAGV